jgi:formate-dependent phosphoribosylglycinamide formyltransferase (GAR transformylase)
MNVIMLSPGFPGEMPLFTRGLAQVGAQVMGVGEQPEGALPDLARRSLVAYLQVESLWDEDRVIERVRRWTSGLEVHRVECLWEPAMLLAARLREAVGVVGMTPEQTVPFRDKEVMKRELDAKNIRTPRHVRATSVSACREAAERVGYPLIIKPIAGAGSADTYRVESPAELDRAAERMRHVPEVSVEEFIDGEEYTFDTICIEGRILYYNVAWYRPRPLIGRTVEWISPQTVTLRDVEKHEAVLGKKMGQAVLDALGFRTGFTHMEWFLKPDGEAVFGEIAARPPGARSVELMNYASDIDVFRGWAEATCSEHFSQVVRRKYNAAVVFKRARGQGSIARIEGLENIMARYGPHVVSVELLPVGAPRRNWRQTLLSDGWVILRHPDLQTTLEMADRVGTDLQLYAE